MQSRTRAACFAGCKQMLIGENLRTDLTCRREVMEKAYASKKEQ